MVSVENALLELGQEAGFSWGRVSKDDSKSHLPSEIRSNITLKTGSGIRSRDARSANGLF